MSKPAKLSTLSGGRVQRLADSGHDTGLPAPTDATSRWYRRPGILVAAGALIAEVGIVVSGTGEPVNAPDGTTPTSTPWSASFSLIATGWIPTPEPPPPPPPAAAPPPPEPVAEAPAPAPTRAASPVWDPPEAVAPPPPPPPPPPQLVFRLDDPITAAFVSMTNHENQPAVGCLMRTVPVGGPAAAVNYNVPDNPFTLTGSQEARIPAGGSLGPPTGSSWHLTVTCDNGLSSSLDAVY